MLSVRSFIALTIVFFLSLPVAPVSAEQMLATWYSCPFGPDCVANRHYPKGTALRLFNVKTGKSARGIVRDYGPKAWTGRSLDVSSQIAELLGMKSEGVASLEVSIIYRP
jgi:hypothetical protein